MSSAKRQKRQGSRTRRSSQGEQLLKAVLQRENLEKQHSTRQTSGQTPKPAATEKQNQFAFGKKVSNLGRGYGRTGWAYAHQNNQVKDGTFVGDTAVSVKKDKPDSRMEHSHAKDVGQLDDVKDCTVCGKTNFDTNDATLSWGGMCAACCAKGAAVELPKTQLEQAAAAAAKTE